jgi:hypothetical protein
LFFLFVLFPNFCIDWVNSLFQSCWWGWSGGKCYTMVASWTCTCYCKRRWQVSTHDFIHQSVFKLQKVLNLIYSACSVGMWDVTLGQPCVRHIATHTRCANAVSLCCDIILGRSLRLPLLMHWFFLWNKFQVAVAPKDDYISTGGSDQKVVSCLFGLLVSYVALCCIGIILLFRLFCRSTTIEINRKPCNHILVVYLNWTWFEDATLFNHSYCEFSPWLT